MLKKKWYLLVSGILIVAALVCMYLQIAKIPFWLAFAAVMVSALGPKIFDSNSKKDAQK